MNSDIELNMAGELDIATHRMEVLRGRVGRLESALQRIERWFGEFPETGDFYDEEKTRPVSYGAAYGSNGERDFMRQIAREALQTLEQSDSRVMRVNNG